MRFDTQQRSKPGKIKNLLNEISNDTFKSLIKNNFCVSSSSAKTFFFIPQEGLKVDVYPVTPNQIALFIRFSIIFPSDQIHLKLHGGLAAVAPYVPVQCAHAQSEGRLQ